MSEETVQTLAPPLAPPAKRGAAKKAAAATPTTPPPIEGMKVKVDVGHGPGLLAEDQRRRLEALTAAKNLLGRDVTARELLDLASYVELGCLPYEGLGHPIVQLDVDDDEPTVLTFSGAPTHQEGITA